MSSVTNLGILGGGQLAMLLTESAIRLGINVKVLDPTINCPASMVGAVQTVGSFKDYDDVKAFCDVNDLNVLTYDIESVNLKALSEIEGGGMSVYPSSSLLKTVQDKYLQKTFFESLDSVKQPRFLEISTKSYNTLSLDGSCEIILKCRKGGYDGKGVWKLKTYADVLNIIKVSGMNESEFYFEELINFNKEIAVTVGRSIDGKVCHVFPIVDTYQKNGICTNVIAPASLYRDVKNEVSNVAVKIANEMNLVGVMSIELFVCDAGQVYINEVSPRVHNSCHYSIEGCVISQFEYHVRSICGMNVIEPALISSLPIMMQNILASGVKNVDEEKKGCLSYQGAHWYHKIPRKGLLFETDRKIGHYTRHLKYNEVPYPLVYVVMGSSSDLPVMQPAIDLLREYRISVKVDIVSAHRSPKWMYEFGDNVESWGGKVIIAGAGGAAHLPGMLASLTALPVIGVPVPSKHLRGEDSLLSIVEMPDGVPVATVGIGKAKNAGILAMKMLGFLDCCKDIMKKNEQKVVAQRKSLIFINK